jgi:hypothetical protein
MANTENKLPVKDDFNRIEGNVGELDTKKANQADLASHTDASAPHSGHATTSALSGHTGGDHSSCCYVCSYG